MSVGVVYGLVREGVYRAHPLWGSTDLRLVHPGFQLNNLYIAYSFTYMYIHSETRLEWKNMGPLLVSA